MTNWLACKYGSFIALRNDATNYSLWRSAAVNTPRNGISATTQNRGKTLVPMPSHKRPHGSIGEKSQGNHNNFGGNGSKGASSSNTTWRHLTDAK